MPENKRQLCAAVFHTAYNSTDGKVSFVCHFFDKPSEGSYNKIIKLEGIPQQAFAMFEQFVQLATEGRCSRVGVAAIAE